LLFSLSSVVDGFILSLSTLFRSRTVDALAEEQREAPADAREERDPRREPEDERAAVGDQVTDQPAEVAQRTARDLVVESTQVERSEEHTSELQSRENLVCRLLLE